MSTLTINLPDDELAHLEARVADGSFDTADAYIEELIRRDRASQAEHRLKQTLLEGVKGPFEEATDDWWNRLDAEAEELCRKKDGA